MKIALLLFFSIFTLTLCDTELPKVTFDITQLDVNGHYGPPDGKRALDYVFCIPNLQSVQTVKDIEPELQCTLDKHGNHCGSSTQYCIGTTNANWNTVLRAIGQLSYVDKIDQMFWE